MGCCQLRDQQKHLCITEFCRFQTLVKKEAAPGGIDLAAIAFLGLWTSRWARTVLFTHPRRKKGMKQSFRGDGGSPLRFALYYYIIFIRIDHISYYTYNICTDTYMYWYLYVLTLICTDTYNILYIYTHQYYHTSYIIYHTTSYNIHNTSSYIIYNINTYMYWHIYIYTPILSYIIYHISYNIHTSSYIMHDISYQISYTHTHIYIYVYI